jgi:HK97 family phage major capsid protein
LCYATDELLEDASALESWITTNVPNELRLQVEAAIMNGNGVGKPLGILKSPGRLGIERLDAGLIQVEDVLSMWAHRLLGVNDYVWTINGLAWPQLPKMKIGDTPVYMPPTGISGSQYGSMLGRPVIETEYNPLLGTEGDLMLVSPSHYLMIDKDGVQSASSMHVAFVTDEQAFRFTYRCDGETENATPIASYVSSSDYVSPFVTLSASS